MQQCRVGETGCPGIGLGGLCFRRRARRQEVGLPQLQGVDDDFQAVIQHPAGVGVVMAFRGWKGLYPFGVSLQWGPVERGVLLSGDGGELPDALQQFLAMGLSQQGGGAPRREQACDFLCARSG